VFFNLKLPLLRIEPNPPILDFPLGFRLDLNGKEQDLDAIVKILFIGKKIKYVAESGGLCVQINFCCLISMPSLTFLLPSSRTSFHTC
jgi:hypothetical protein